MPITVTRSGGTTITGRGTVAQHSVSGGASDVLQQKLAAGYLVYGCVLVF